MRIASLPHGHVYVEHLADPEDDDVERLPDPRPADPAVGAPWWPLGMLDPAWVSTHAEEFDVYHLHFGFDSESPERLQEILDTVHGVGAPVVYTVHDLRNPHQVDRRPHDAALDVLIPGADQLVTLTSAAAEEIDRRWQRRARVIPHPHVVPLGQIGQRRARRARPRVGLHLKSLRPSMNPVPVLELLAEEAPALGVDLVVDAHTDVVTPGERNHSPEVTALLRQVQQRPGVTVNIHDFYSDAELWRYLAGLDLSVLPYRFGTHSGWLEACYDLGTRVLAPRLGCYHDQHEGVLGYHLDDADQPSRADVRAALERLARPGSWQADAQDRWAQRRAIARAHREVYSAALAGDRS